MTKITDIPPAPGLGAFCIGAAMGDDDRVHLSLMRREPAGGSTVLLSDSFAVRDLHRQDLLLLGAGLRELPTRRVSTSGWIQVIPEAAPTTLQWDDEPPATEPIDVDGKTAAGDPMLAYYRDWYRLQSLKGDPARRGNLARDAYLSGAAQGALLARTTSVTIRAPQVDESADVHGKQVDETAEMHGLTTSDAILAELVARKDLKDALALETYCAPDSSARADWERRSAEYTQRLDASWNAARAFLATAAPEPDAGLRNLQTWLVCREIGNALQPELTTVQGWVAALSPITGEPAPDFLMRATGPAEVSPTVALCIEQLDLWSGRLEAAIDRTAHEQLGQHANDELAAGGRDPMEQYP